MAGTSYCIEHQQANNAAAYKRLSSRYSASDPIRKLYQCRRWTKGTRLAVLRRDPLCMMCGHKASTVADHHPLTARQIIAEQGVQAFYDPTHCQGLCASCHSSKTAKEDSTFAHRLS